MCSLYTVLYKTNQDLDEAQEALGYHTPFDAEQVDVTSEL